MADYAALIRPTGLIETGFVPDLESSPAKLRRLIEDEIVKWTPIVRALDVKID
jgi:hypothetical protein